MCALIKADKNELSIDLSYHSVDHTYDVHRAATRYCRMEELSEHDQQLVLTAATYHDSGMLKTYIDHEEAAIEIVKEVLPGFDYTDEEIRIINQMILTTKLPQSAKSLMDKILCDADLDYLGRVDFFMIAPRLQYEWNVLKIKPTTCLVNKKIKKY